MAETGDETEKQTPGVLTPEGELAQALEESEALTQAVMDSLAAHVAVLDSEGSIVATNEAWRRFARDNARDATDRTGVGVNYLEICQGACGESSEGAADVYRGLHDVLAGRASQFYHEYPCHSPSERRWFLLQATGLRGLNSGAVLLHINITERKLMEGKLQERERLRLLAAGLMDGQEKERKRIARELHDGLNQQVALLSIEMGMLARQLPDEARTEIRKLQQQAAELSDQIRRISHQLHPSALEHLGAVAAIQQYCAEFAEHEGLPVRLTIEQAPGEIAADVGLCLYRVVQECLRNAVKHARATEARLILKGLDGDIDLTVTDDGIGFDTPSPGLGLVSMEERVTQLGGCFAVTSAPRRGVSVHVLIPAKGQSE